MLLPLAEVLHLAQEGVREEPQVRRPGPIMICWRTLRCELREARQPGGAGDLLLIFGRDMTLFSVTPEGRFRKQGRGAVLNPHRGESPRKLGWLQMGWPAV